MMRVSPCCPHQISKLCVSQLHHQKSALFTVSLLSKASTTFAGKYKLVRALEARSPGKQKAVPCISNYISNSFFIYKLYKQLSDKSPLLIMHHFQLFAIPPKFNLGQRQRALLPNASAFIIGSFTTKRILISVFLISCFHIKEESLEDSIEHTQRTPALT